MWDTIVVGSGIAGFSAAAALARRQRRVRRGMGGAIAVRKPARITRVRPLPQSLYDLTR